MKELGPEPSNSGASPARAQIQPGSVKIAGMELQSRPQRPKITMVQGFSMAVTILTLLSAAIGFFAVFLLPNLTGDLNSGVNAHDKLARPARAAERKLSSQDAMIGSYIHSYGDSGCASQACETYLGGKVDCTFSVVMTADPGDMSGTAEAHYILDNLKHVVQKPRGDSVCADMQFGELMGQQVLVATSGIGPSAASMCTLELATVCGPWISELIYFGTSGWSPQIGGVLNPPDCSAANTNKNIVRTGDVCISPFSVNWVCKKATWLQQTMGSPNQCTRPDEFTGPEDTALFGKCVFYKDNVADNLALSMELTKIARSSTGSDNQPLRAQAVAEHEKLYWESMRNATGVDYPYFDREDPPSVFDHSQCMEADGQFFYSGAPWELTARRYIAETMNSAMALQYSQLALQWGARSGNIMAGSAKAFTEKDVIAVGAMEAVGVAAALEKYHSLSTTVHKIPYTNIRTASNWLVPAVTQTTEGFWEVVPDPIPEDFVHGYDYAIASGSSVIMSFYQKRCLHRRSTGHLPADHSCSFSIEYDSDS